MHLPRTQRKLILLYARLVELFSSGEALGLGRVSTTNEGETYFSIIDDKGKIIDDFPVSEQALKKWRTKIAPHTDTLREIDNTIKNWFQADWEGNKFPISDPENKTPVFKFAGKIGLEPAKARYIIDRQFAHDLPTYSSLTSSTSQANRFVEEFGGIYYLYRHDMNSLTEHCNHPQGVLIRCTVSIRYPVPYSLLDSSKRGISRVRCKINIPCLNRDKSKPFKYDGYVSKKGKNWWNWLIQMRPSGSDNVNQEDLALLYTEKPKKNENGDILACGEMVTQNQEKEMVPTVSTICLIKIQKYSVKKATIIYGVGSSSMKKLSKSLDSYYQCEPEDEKGIMRENLAIIDLSDSSKWESIDEIAIKKIFDGGVTVNLKGLHL